MTPAIERIDLPYRRMRTWHCECEVAGCEASTESEIQPCACPLGRTGPKWRLGRWQRCQECH